MVRGKSISSQEGTAKEDVTNTTVPWRNLEYEYIILKSRVTQLGTPAAAGSGSTRHWSWAPPSTEDRTKVGLKLPQSQG